MRIVIAVFMLTVLAGCGSSPKTNYFTLDATAPGGKHAIALAHPVQIAAVHVPPSLDRRQMVLRTGANAVKVSGEDRWTAPLGAMTREVLAQDLAARLHAGDVILPDAPAPPHARQIVVAITQFGTDKNGTPILEGSWTLLEGETSKPLFDREIALHGTSPVSGGQSASAAMSRLLGQLSAQMATALGHETASQEKGG